MVKNSTIARSRGCTHLRFLRRMAPPIPCKVPSSGFLAPVPSSLLSARSRPPSELKFLLQHPRVQLTGAEHAPVEQPRYPSREQPPPLEIPGAPALLLVRPTSALVLSQPPQCGLLLPYALSCAQSFFFFFLFLFQSSLFFCFVNSALASFKCAAALMYWLEVSIIYLLKSIIGSFDRRLTLAATVGRVRIWVIDPTASACASKPTTSDEASGREGLHRRRNAQRWSLGPLQIQLQSPLCLWQVWYWSSSHVHHEDHHFEHLRHDPLHASAGYYLLPLDCLCEGL